MINLKPVDFPSATKILYLFKGKYKRYDNDIHEGVVSVQLYKVDKENKSIMFTSSAGGGGFEYHCETYRNKSYKPYFLEGEWYEVS